MSVVYGGKLFDAALEYHFKKRANLHAFKIFGLVPKSEFDLELLQSPLKALFETNYCKETWDELYADLLGGEFEVEPGSLAAPEWYHPQDKPFSLFQCFCQKMHG
jgi:hypothetical protein